MAEPADVEKLTARIAELEQQLATEKDGFEWDRFLMTSEKGYIPKGIGPDVRLFSGKLPEFFPEEDEN